MSESETVVEYAIRGMSAAEGGVALVCPYCGAGLTINTETVGQPYLTYERPESIECDAYTDVHCGATWEPNGTPRDAPGWVRWPELYSKPTAEPAPIPAPVAGGEDRR